MTPRLILKTETPAIDSVELLDQGVDISSTRCLLAPIKTSEREGFLLNCNLESLQREYLKWVKNNVFVGVQLDIDDLETGDHETKLKFMLAPKRGNDKYARMLEARLREFNSTLPDTQFFNPKLRRTQTTPMFKVTMTYNPKKCSRYHAWKNIGHELNKFRSNLVKYFGCEISIIHTWENFKKPGSPAYGYPHINLIVMLDNKRIKTFYHNGEWRISCKRDLEKYWHSHMDVKAVSRVGSWNEEDQPENNESYISLAHNTKYITKDIRQSRPNDDYVLLNAILWCMRKRAYSFNGSFLARFNLACDRLDNVEAISNFPELKLADNPRYNVKIALLGVFPGCIFKCIKRLRGKLPENCPYLRFASSSELRDNWGISKFNCGSSNTENDNVRISFTDTGLNYHLQEQLSGLEKLKKISMIMQAIETWELAQRIKADVSFRGRPYAMDPDGTLQKLSPPLHGALTQRHKSTAVNNPHDPTLSYSPGETYTTGETRPEQGSDPAPANSSQSILSSVGRRAWVNDHSPNPATSNNSPIEPINPRGRDLCRGERPGKGGDPHV